MRIALISLIVARMLSVVSFGGPGGCGAATYASSSTDTNDDTDNAGDSTASLIGIWQRVAEDCNCIIVWYIKFEEAGGGIYARHSTDNSIFEDRMIVTAGAADFSFEGDTSDFWKDCEVTEDVECSGTATEGMATMRLDCSVAHVGCNIDLEKL